MMPIEKKILQQKIKASSLIEVVISLVLILLIFGIAMMTFVNVSRSGISFQQVNTKLVLANIYLSTLKEKSFFDEEIPDGNNKIKKHVVRYSKSKHLWLMELEARNPEGKILAKRRDLILSYEKED